MHPFALRTAATGSVAAAGFAAAVGLVACRSTAPPRVVEAIGIATDPQTATAQALAGERAKKNLALLLRAEGSRFTYVSHGSRVAVQAEREGRATMLRTQYRSLSRNTWIAVTRAARPSTVVEALGVVPFQEYDVTVRDGDLARAYRRAEVSLFRAFVEAMLGKRTQPTFVAGQIIFVDLVSDFGEDWVRLAARARVQIEDARRPTAAELERLRASAIEPD